MHGVAGGLGHDLDVPVRAPCLREQRPSSAHKTQHVSSGGGSPKGRDPPLFKQEVLHFSPLHHISIHVAGPVLPYATWTRRGRPRLPEGRGPVEGNRALLQWGLCSRNPSA